MDSFCTTCSVSRGPGPASPHLCFLSSCSGGFGAKCTPLTPQVASYYNPGGRDSSVAFQIAELQRWRPCPHLGMAGQSWDSTWCLMSGLLLLLPHCGLSSIYEVSDHFRSWDINCPCP